MPIYIVGHKNPDTDSVASAIGYAELKKKMGVDAVAVTAGSLNKGTKLVLDLVGVEPPQIIDFHDIPEETVILVDHNEEGQRADGLIKEHVVEVIDHHRFADFSSAVPIYIRVHPWGATASIVARMYQESNHIPEKHVATLLLSAILTDTLMFKSPTTTINDMEIADWLNEIAEIDMVAHATEIFAAKSDITGMSLVDVINKDFKEFHFNDHVHLGIAVFETVDASGPLVRKEEFLKELVAIKAAKKYDNMLFYIVDIIKQVAYFIVTDEADAELLEHVFKVAAKDGVVELPGVVSRKKQVVPALEEHFAGHES